MHTNGRRSLGTKTMKLHKHLDFEQAILAVVEHFCTLGLRPADKLVADRPNERLAGRIRHARKVEMTNEHLRGIPHARGGEPRRVRAEKRDVE
jgi:hypothetical protein